MKKIQDYFGQSAGISCETQEEWDIACDLTAFKSECPDKRRGFRPHSNNNAVGIYKGGGHGWTYNEEQIFSVLIPLKEFLNTNKEIYFETY